MRYEVESMLKVTWPVVITEYDVPIIEWINLCNVTMYRIIAFKTYYPKHALFVGIEFRGAFLFSVDNDIYADYVTEKLGIGHSDAAVLADWINAQLGHEVPQQGEYYIRELVDNSSHGLLFEDKSKPLVPRILSES